MNTTSEMVLNTLADIFLVSLPGTVIMTLFMYFYSAFLKKETRVIHIFGSMITGDTPVRNVSGKLKSVVTGTLVHFIVGFFFALLYFAMIQQGVAGINFGDAFITGLISSVFAIIVWRSYLFLHFHPPRISVVHFFISLFFAMLIFTIITFYSFKLMMPGYF